MKLAAEKSSQVECTDSTKKQKKQSYSDTHIKTTKLLSPSNTFFTTSGKGNHNFCYDIVNKT